MGLAERTGGEIISVDSVQVYREMDIGSAKPSGLMQARVRHHLIDVVDPEESFTAADCQRLARGSSPPPPLPSYCAAVPACTSGRWSIRWSFLPVTRRCGRP